MPKQETQLRSNTAKNVSTKMSLKKRDGRTVSFEPERIRIAIAGAFREEYGLNTIEELSNEILAVSYKLTEKITRDAQLVFNEGDLLEVEQIQDMVEQQLMRDGFLSIARRYIIYRENHRKSRALRGEQLGEKEQLQLTLPDGSKRPLTDHEVVGRLRKACRGFETSVDLSALIDETMQNLYDGVRLDELNKALILAPRSRIEKDPAYIAVSSRVLLDVVYNEVFSHHQDVPVAISEDEVKALHIMHFKKFIHLGIKENRISEKLKDFDLDALSSAIDLSRDQKFAYLGLQTLYDRYFLHIEGKRIESPQYFWMRVSMGLAINEGRNKDQRAIEFYNTLSSFRFVSSTPTLFNSGTCHPQLSSCYLSTVDDDLENIFKVISDNAKLSKWAGGLGNDWTNVRATGSRIKGTNGLTQGVVPFLKVANDTAVAVNQGGKRKGALCSYLETWHLDIEDFLELRRNTGDERRRTHDMNTSNWIPDLFMKRVTENKNWTLFSPSDVPDLHDLYGKAFEKRYEEYEKMVERGEITLFKTLPAMDLWRKMITMVFETGHPWITFKDPSNIRSPQDHVGVVHSSNLCTEILLNTSKEEIAVCNLGSINLPWHLKPNNTLDENELKKTIRTAIRMLDNVIDINFYPTKEAENSNMRHRPVGMGIMGFQDCLYKMRISYDNPKAAEFADASMEMVSYYAILTSSELAKEKGAYSTYKGSKWDRGLLPIDTQKMLREERGSEYIVLNEEVRMDWDKVRASIKKYGMRNSNTMAIAPTATIANIASTIDNQVTQSIEPTYSHMFTKSNLSGEFIILNPYLVEDLKELGFWDQDMIDDLKYFDGSVSEVERIPENLKEIYKTAFELKPSSLIECASRRQKWIDMGQSLNLYAHAPNGRTLSDMYIEAWRKGLKTSYYLRSRGATTVEKSSLDINKRGLQPRWMKNKSASSSVVVERQSNNAPKACSIMDPDCESCQ